VSGIVHREEHTMTPNKRVAELLNREELSPGVVREG
jgi:hypothetical protein